MNNLSCSPLRRFLVLGLALALLAIGAAFIANASDGDDRESVAALDTQYQAAVKANDAATMDRLLAPGFIFVTGSGETHTKTDLLEEARSRRTHYEHQEAPADCPRLGRYRRHYRQALAKRNQKRQKL